VLPYWGIFFLLTRKFPLQSTVGLAGGGGVSQALSSCVFASLASLSWGVTRRVLLIRRAPTGVLLHAVRRLRLG
jgi:hypothetical protein